MPSPPIVIAHRGASGYRPEHTLASYRLALELGADFIEPDLVPTRDGVLVARHENELSTTTDVAAHPEFAERHTTKLIDGSTVVGWFSEDFTLTELKQLRARERIPELRPDNVAFDRMFEIPTFDEILDLVRQTARPVGIYPETKHPSYFAGIGLPLEAALVNALHEAGYRDPSEPVFIQSFETSNLQRLRSLTRLRLVQLMDLGPPPFDWTQSHDPARPEIFSAAGLDRVAGYADAIGVSKQLVWPRDARDRLAAPTDLVALAHARNLLLHVWTFRAENAFLPLEYRNATTPSAAAHGDLSAELTAFFGLGIDGVFADQPDIALAARSGSAER
jgi:glycerophosphoryl diester phosphodiesterase